MSRLLACALFIALTLAACGGGDKAGSAKRADGSALDALPTPEGARGSVTGMPDRPGPGQPEAGSTVVSPDAYTGVDDMPVDETGGLGEDAGTGDEANPSGEPTAQDAVDAVEQYYAALQARDFGSAYAAWSDGGRSSGQTPEQFAAGFADTAQIVATLDSPARVEGAAMGSRYIEVPVAVETTSNDGRVRRYVGAYTLRRSVVDGATDEQRAWRIASADLRELSQ